jgi:hypothetical protein
VLSVEDDLGLVRQVAAGPGSLIIFNEALVHGTLPWQPADRMRRSILFKYSPGFMTWVTPFAACPIKDPTPEELAMYEPPHRTGRMVLGDGKEEREIIYAHSK